MQPINPYAGLKNAQIFDRGTYIQPDTSIDLEVKKCIWKRTQRSGEATIVEFNVLNSNNPAHPPGSSVTWYQSMKTEQTAMSAIKEFAAALHGFHPRDEKQRIEVEFSPFVDDIMGRAITPENLLAGKRIHCETHAIITKEKKEDFTVHTWTPYGSTPVRAAMAAPPAVKAPPPQGGAYAPPAMPAQFSQGSPLGSPFGAPPPQAGQYAPQPQYAPQGQPQPQYAPQGQPQYAPQGPYQPQAPQAPYMPQHAPQGQPQAPQYAPQQPQYAPQAPQYGQPPPGWRP